MKNLKLFVFALCAVLLSVVTVNADNTVTTPSQCNSNNLYVDHGDGTFTCTDGFIAALNSIKDNEKAEIVLVKDKTLSTTAFSIEKDVTINLNGHKLTTDTVNSNNMTIKGANVTIKNGTLDLLKNHGHIVVDSSTKASTLTIANDVKVNATYSSTSAIQVKDATEKTVVNLNGTWTVAHELVACEPGKDKNLTINLNADVKATDLQSDSLVDIDAGTSTVNVNGGTYESNKGVFKLVNGTLNINGGTMVSNGTLATIVVRGSTNDYTANLNITDGNVVAVKKNVYSIRFASDSGKETGTYKISGGKFTSGKDNDGKQLPAIQISSTNLLTTHPGIITGGSFTSAIVGDVTTGVDTYTTAAKAAAILTGNATTTNANGVVTVGGKDEGTSKPGAKPGDEPAPNTFDAGLVYMGLALSAIGASVVSVRKLRNN